MHCSLKKGDRVRFTSAFLVRAGRYSAIVRHARGTIEAIRLIADSKVAVVTWTSPYVPTHVQVHNLVLILGDR